MQKGLCGFLFLLSDADDLRIFAVESRVIVKAEIVCCRGLLDAAENHVVSGDDLLGPDILHDGGLHVFLKTIGKIRL